MQFLVLNLSPSPPSHLHILLASAPSSFPQKAKFLDKTLGEGDWGKGRGRGKEGGKGEGREEEGRGGEGREEAVREGGSRR